MNLSNSHPIDRHWAVMTSIACGILFVVLVSLAFIQYRWLGDLRQAERRQLELSLKATAERFAHDFVSELLAVVTAFQQENPTPLASLAGQLKDSYEQWTGSAPHPALIRELLIATGEASAFRVFQFDTAAGVLQPAKDLIGVDVLNATLAASHGRYRAKDAVFLEDLSTLAVPFVAREKTRQGGLQDVAGWIIARLDRKLIAGELLPLLFARHFTGAEAAPYRVAVALDEPPYRLLYQSETMTDDDLKSPDLVLDLVPERGGKLKAFGPQATRIVAADSPQWQLLVKHRMGSLDAAVENLRRRNLAIGAAILLVLGVSALLVVIAAGRARTLGRMQAEFAAAVSHELRTPLAVIRAAAYNLEEGIVDDQSQVRHYAGVVRTAGRRLSTMVDQILLFAEAQSGKREIDIFPINACEVIDNALQEVRSMCLPDGCLIERDIQPNLPLMLANPVLLSHCVQNLVNNAVKYGHAGEATPIRISAAADTAGREVRITVSDQGPGIDNADLPHIFKPFYRGKTATADPSGTGLGLALVERLMQGQRGRVTVRTSPSGGSSFTLHLSIVI